VAITTESRAEGENDGERERVRGKAKERGRVQLTETQPLDGAAEYFLTPSIRIAICSVEEVETELHSPLDDGEGVLLALHPLTDFPLRVAKTHAPKGETRYLQPRSAKISEFHRLQHY